MGGTCAGRSRGTRYTRPRGVRRRPFLARAAVLLAAACWTGAAHRAGAAGNPGGRLASVRVAAQYRYLTDGAGIHRSLDEAFALLEALDTELIFQGWVTEWQPLVERCGDLASPAERDACERAGYSYRHLAEAVGRVRERMPGTLVGGGLLAEFLYPETFDPITGERLDRDQAWSLALDPQKWGLSPSREDLQRRLAAEVFHWTDDPAHYDPRRQMRAFFPDITDPRFQRLFLDLARRQIDLGVDALWIDALFAQARLFREYGETHPAESEAAGRAARDAYDAASQLLDRLHEYSWIARGRPVDIVTWPDPIEFPYPQPALDGVMTSPSAAEVLAGTLDAARWDALLARIRTALPGIPVFARIDYGEHDRTPLAVFSQVLSPDEQRAFLRTADRFFAARNVIFVYPVHGGYMGAGARRLAFGTSPFYDSLAPEFDTYGTIQELARLRAGARPPRRPRGRVHPPGRS